MVDISGFSIVNFTVAGEIIDTALDNYGPNALGSLNTAPSLLVNGQVVILQG